MENTPLKNFTSIQKEVAKFKMFAITMGAIAIFVFLGGVVVIGFVMMTTQQKYIIVDRRGYTYTSESIDERTATALQFQSFVYNFVKLAYAFDPNNIEANLNRAVAMADGSFSTYVSKHSQPNEIYQLIKVGSIAKLYEQELLKNIQIEGNKFTLRFTQSISGASGSFNHIVSIQGDITYVTPKDIDNPNGFFITNYIENYER